MTLPLPRPVFDAHASGGGFGNLPEWDLRDLYAAPDAPEFARDMAWLEKACAGFAAAYEGRLATLDAAAMLRAVQEYEQIDVTAGRIMSYAGLRYYQNTMDSERAKFMADAQDRVTVFTTPLVFWSLEFNRLDDAHLAGLLAANADLARYKPVFDRMRAMRPHQLSDELERFLHDESVVGASAWNKLFDETMAGMMFTVAGEAEELNLEATLNLLTDTDRARREAAARALAEGSAGRSSFLHASTTRWRRKRRSTTAGARCPAPSTGGTCRTMSSPRWSRRCGMPWWRPIRSCRTATTG